MRDGDGEARHGRGAVVNGPEDEVSDWASIDWRRVEDDVRRLRQRIFTASQAGDLKKVRNLQKLMLRSRASTLLSVRRVTEVNAGRKTAGIDGKAALLPRANTTRVPLTERQREIVALAATGLSNRRIAEHLTMSVRTVEGHLFRASRKAGVNTREELIALIEGK